MGDLIKVEARTSLGNVSTWETGEPRQAAWVRLWDRLLRNHDSNDPTEGEHTVARPNDDSRVTGEVRVANPE